MGLFGKTRVGKFTAVAGSPNRFEWIIPAFSTYNANSLMDSEIVQYKKVKFHLHGSIDAKGNVGLYIHFKSPPIPKYSYFFMNSDGKVMPQHTAYTIPVDTERCGHWNVCTRGDMLEFLGSSDTLRIVLIFDDDTINVNYMSNTVIVTWTIPHVHTQYLNPFSSSGFTVNDSQLSIRVDTKREGELISNYDPTSIENYLFFVFCRKGKFVPHTIELLDAQGQSYAKLEKRDDNDAAALIVPRETIDSHVGSNSRSTNNNSSNNDNNESNNNSTVNSVTHNTVNNASKKNNGTTSSHSLQQSSKNGTLCCKVSFYTCGNPLEQLNKSNEHSVVSGNRNNNSNDNDKNNTTSNKTVALG